MKGQKLKLNRLKIVLLLSAALFYSFNAIAQKVVIKSDDQKMVINKGSHTYTNTKISGLHSFNIEYKGKIEVTDDDKDVKSISPGGYLEISKTTFGSKREIIIEAATGGLRKEYFEGRKQMAWEPDGKKWLAEILPEIVRSTGIAAESRVNRYFKKGGAAAVVEEISRLEGDYVKTIYAKLLIAKDGLTTNDLKTIVKGISSEIDSDYYLAEILKDNSGKFLKNDEIAEYYFEAVLHISSDYYASVVLKEALKDHRPSASSISKIMEASKNIGSDYYQASVLSAVLDNNDLSGALIADVIETTKDIGSDYYQSQILTKAVEKKGLSDESFNSLLEAVSDVSSDYYMASVFSRLAENELNDEVQVKLIRLVDEKMSSDYYASSVLSKIMEQNLSARGMEEMAKAIGNIGSAHYASSIIRNVSKSGDINKQTLLSLIEASSNISSDYYKSTALESIAPMVRKSDSEVKEAYMKVAKTINSDTYFGKAMRAID